MPADTLTYAASSVVPMEPRTSFFDPTASLGVMERYGMSARARGFAEDSLKTASNIMAYEEQTKARDRRDLEYEEKKDFESTLGTFLVDLAKLDEDADDFDEQMARLIADPRALDNEGVKAIYNLKVQQRGEKFQIRKSEDAYEKRFRDEMALVLPPDKLAEITDENGYVNRPLMSKVLAGDRVAEAQTKALEKDREERLNYYNGDRDVANATSLEEVEPLYTARRQTFLESATKAGVPLAVRTGDPDAGYSMNEFDRLVSQAPALTAEGFVAGLMKFDTALEGLKDLDNPEERFMYILSQGKTTNDPRLQPMVKAAMDLFNAAHARGHLAPRAKEPGDAPESRSTPSAPEDDIAERLRRAKEKAEREGR